MSAMDAETAAIARGLVCRELQPWACLLYAGLGPLAECGEPAACTATLACLHEHIGEIRLCYSCAAEMQMTAGFITCAHCADSTDPHECYPEVTITWDASRSITRIQGTEGVSLP